MATSVERRPEERVWLLRALLVSQSPRPVFAALRDDSDDTARARGEAVLALIWLAGIAAVLASPHMSTLMDDPADNDIGIASIVIFLAGGMYGALAYFLLSAVLHAFLRASRHRQLPAHTTPVRIALTPIALSLVTFWVVRIASRRPRPLQVRRLRRRPSLREPLLRLRRVDSRAGRRRRPHHPRLEPGALGRRGPAARPRLRRYSCSVRRSSKSSASNSSSSSAESRTCAAPRERRLCERRRRTARAPPGSPAELRVLLDESGPRLLVAEQVVVARTWPSQRAPAPIRSSESRPPP
jgi:hypothetical protein